MRRTLVLSVFLNNTSEALRESMTIPSTKNIRTQKQISVCKRASSTQRVEHGRV